MHLTLSHAARCGAHRDNGADGVLAGVIFHPKLSDVNGGQGSRKHRCEKNVKIRSHEEKQLFSNTIIRFGNIQTFSVPKFFLKKQPKRPRLTSAISSPVLSWISSRLRMEPSDYTTERNRRHPPDHHQHQQQDKHEAVPYFGKKRWTLSRQAPTRDAPPTAKTRRKLRASAAAEFFAICVLIFVNLLLHDSDKLRLLGASQHFFLGLVAFLHSGFELLRIATENRDPKTRRSIRLIGSRSLEFDWWHTYKWLLSVKKNKNG